LKLEKRNTKERKLQFSIDALPNKYLLTKILTELSTQKQKINVALHVCSLMLGKMHFIIVPKISLFVGSAVGTI
jgi:hypothetical protein